MNTDINTKLISDININLLTNKINELYDDAFKCVYEIVKRNNETIIKTKNYYLVNLDNVSQQTLRELSVFLNYLDASFDHLTNDEIEKNKLRSELAKIN